MRDRGRTVPSGRLAGRRRAGYDRRRHRTKGGCVHSRMIGIALVGLAALGVSTALAGGGKGTTDGRIVACQKNGGFLRIVDSASRCRQSERVVIWNIRGPAGENGPAGPAGPPGPAVQPDLRACRSEGRAGTARNARSPRGRTDRRDRLGDRDLKAPRDRRAPRASTALQGPARTRWACRTRLARRRSRRSRGRRARGRTDPPERSRSRPRLPT